LIDLLVSKGALVNATDYHALSPLHLSCQKGYQGVTVRWDSSETVIAWFQIFLCCLTYS
jgi:hypothetical protein